MGRGHGGTGSSTWRGGGGMGATEQGYSQAMARAVLGAEESVRGNDYETAFIFDEQGNMTYQKKGNATSVTFDEGTVFTDRVITHNHPAPYSDAKGRPIRNSSLSDGDIITAVSENAKEMRAVSANYRFSMKRPETGWGVRGNKIGSKVAGARRSVDTALKKYVQGYKGDKKTAIARADQIYWHLVNKRLSATMGYSYTKQRIR